ncbi:type VI secretion system accessory protein TagJ [Sedimentisphaera salicampi]|uniref:Protein of avirulence locus involved in temperature-dependent protein secretion n=1 Tax=Sedimentisphaera salicampi TaxID=1941349 RepID=A0A1W6LME8_9BACT|nr:type VI secretion system accessory protein TagJ [Sedimentisphaera salicampi]ARN56931.1 Protein of avirulence locus involved in temperature-dependent protein secretion [Sedimentisphaera salicampi]
MDAETLLKNCEPQLALIEVKKALRKEPSDLSLRFLLFQLLMLLEDWEKAVSQMELISEIDSSKSALNWQYSACINSELLRKEIFEGRKKPLIMGEPSDWIGLLIEAVSDEGESFKLLADSAYSKAQPASGTVNGESFDWIADCDSRLGPVFEIIAHGKYYWVEFDKIAVINVEQVAELKDLVWLNAKIELKNGGELSCVIPSRYPQTVQTQTPELILSRKTEWREILQPYYKGLGQKMFCTDSNEYALFDIEEIVFN